MSQHDMVVDDGSGAIVLSDINAALPALASRNSGASEPSTKYAYMDWPDTVTGFLKQRDGNNNNWRTIRPLDTRCLKSAAGSDAYSVSLSPAITTYCPLSIAEDAPEFMFRADVANTTGATLNYNSVGAKTIKKLAGTALLALETGDIVVDQVCVLRFDYTGDCFVLLNPMAAPRLQKCRMYLTSDQITTNLTFVKVALNADSFDPSGISDTGNNRILPTLPGYYQVQGKIALIQGAYPTYTLLAAIYKNGVEVSRNGGSFATNGIPNLNISDLIYLDGVDDYVELFVYQYTDTTPYLAGGSGNNYLTLTGPV